MRRVVGTVLIGLMLVISGVVAVLVFSLFCVTAFSVASEAQSFRYTPDEQIPDTEWVYSEKFDDGALN